MKKLFLSLLMIVAILVSVISGTQASYTSTIDFMDSTITAKAFILIAEEVQNFNTTVKLAPGEVEELFLTYRIMTATL